MSHRRVPERLQVWIDARKRHHLSHAHVQMARELGMNPKKLGKIDNHRQEPWKLPLPQFIEHLYFKRFGKPRPDVVVSIEERARQAEAKKAAKREARRPSPHVVPQDLTARYQEMAADEHREAEAHEWVEATLYEEYEAGSDDHRQPLPFLPL